MQPWDLINPVQATLIARMTPDVSPNALKEIFPEREIFDVRYRRARSQRINRTAKFRAWKTESPIGERSFTANIDEGRFIPISEKLALDEADQIELYLAGQSGLNTPAMDNLLQQAYDDLGEIARAIWNRVEVARGQVLYTGKFTLAGENGLTMETDFGLVSAQKPTLSTPFTDITAAAVDVERGWIDYLETLSGKPVARVTTSKRILAALLTNNQYRQFARPGVSLSNLPTLTITEFNSVRASLGLPPLVTYDHQLSVDGVATRVIPDNRYILTVADLGETQWGITADALSLAKAGTVVTRPPGSNELGAAGLIGGTWFTPDPVMKWTKVSGAVMPIMGDPNGVVAATVAA